MKYGFMKNHYPQFEIKKMAEALQVARSGYYAWEKRKDSQKRRMDQELLARIKAVYYGSRSIYGSPRVTAQLNREGFLCGKNRIARLMRINHLRSRKQRRFKATTNSKHAYPVASNLLRQHFSTTGPNTIWVADISYIPTKEGWLYLAGIKDIFTQKIVGWSMDKTMTRKLVMDALQMAYTRQKPNLGLILHSDRGVQYACREYQSLLKKHGIVCSISWILPPIWFCSRNGASIQFSG